MKKTVFISSTFQDLKEYRAEIWNLLNTEYDVEIKGMEDFGARKESPLETCLSEVDQSDIYVGIIGTRFGSVNEKKGKSYTQLEYERALERDKDVFIYIIDEDNAKVPPSLVDKGENYTKLQSFKNKLSKSHTVDFFVDEDDLKRKLKRKFDDLLANKKKDGKPKDEIKYSEEIIEEFKLFPKTHTGTEIKFKGKFKSKYYPASKDICNSFNKKYGDTVIIEVEISSPTNAAEVFDKVLISSKQFKLIKDNLDKEVAYYANLLFSENTIEQFKAYFRTETHTYNRFATITAVNIDPFMKSETYQREGTIILSLNEVILKHNKAN